MHENLVSRACDSPAPTVSVLRAIEDRKLRLGRLLMVRRETRAERSADEVAPIEGWRADDGPRERVWSGRRKSSFRSSQSRLPTVSVDDAPHTITYPQSLPANADWSVVARGARPDSERTACRLRCSLQGGKAQVGIGQRTPSNDRAGSTHHAKWLDKEEQRSRRSPWAV